MKSRNIILLILGILVILIASFFYGRQSFDGRSEGDGNAKVDVPMPSLITSPTLSPISVPRATILVDNLNIPWDVAIIGLNEFLITERPGNIIHIKNDGTRSSVKLPRTVPGGEGGLLGIVLHPKFSDNGYLYLYMTTEDVGGATKNAVFRYKYSDGNLNDEKIIISEIPGAIYHDGGRMEFGPDGMLYVTTGDAQQPQIAQNKNSLGGKILRLTDDGGVPPNNPFGTAVYSYGHRNPQGLAWDEEGRMWETEHGRSGITSGMDEINRIVAGANYGWPDIEGDRTKMDMIVPARHSGANDTWAPASAAYLGGKLYFGGLRGEALYEAVLDGEKVVGFNKYFDKEFGRIRTVRIGPDSMLYLTTSNRDGRGDVRPGDDKLIRINPSVL